jgi:predicted DNA-binding transcriptional regulator AlpA
MQGASETSSPLRLIRKKALARELGCSFWTIDRWVASGQFPRPIYPTDNSPAMWRVRDVETWLAKRSVARRRSHGWRGART